jgi:hypothetical protein
LLLDFDQSMLLQSWRLSQCRHPPPAHLTPTMILPPPPATTSPPYRNKASSSPTASRYHLLLFSPSFLAHPQGRHRFSSSVITSFSPAYGSTPARWSRVLVETLLHFLIDACVPVPVREIKKKDFVGLHHQHELSCLCQSQDFDPLSSNCIG